MGVKLEPNCVFIKKGEAKFTINDAVRVAIVYSSQGILYIFFKFEFELYFSAAYLVNLGHQAIMNSSAEVA